LRRNSHPPSEKRGINAAVNGCCMNNNQTTPCENAENERKNMKKLL